MNQPSKKLVVLVQLSPFRALSVQGLQHAVVSILHHMLVCNLDFTFEFLSLTSDLADNRRHLFFDDLAHDIEEILAVVLDLVLREERLEALFAALARRLLRARSGSQRALELGNAVAGGGERLVLLLCAALPGLRRVLPVDWLLDLDGLDNRLGWRCRGIGTNGGSWWSCGRSRWWLGGCCCVGLLVVGLDVGNLATQRGGKIDLWVCGQWHDYSVGPRVTGADGLGRG
jgi:hypothetical protein